MAEITDEQLTELEEARKNAIPGKWKAIYYTNSLGIGWELVPPINYRPSSSAPDDYIYLNLLLAHADAMIAEIRRLREENEGLKQTIKYGEKAVDILVMASNIHDIGI